MFRAHRSTAPVRTRRHRSARRLAGCAAALLAVGSAGACLPANVPPGAGKVVVFDIDGTLTGDELSNDVQPGAQAAVQGYLAKGYDVVYLTARWNLLEGSTTTWLRDNGFPERPLYTAPGLLVSDAEKVSYKAGVLDDLKDAGRTLHYAYGDSSSDFTAYAQAGIPSGAVFALRRSGATSCQAGTYTACLNGYTAHLSFINAVPAA